MKAILNGHVTAGQFSDRAPGGFLTITFQNYVLDVESAAMLERWIVKALEVAEPKVAKGQ